MNEHFFGIFLLGTSLLQGDIAVSNSPNSPHRKLIDLTEDVSVLKQEMKNIQEVKNNFNEILKKVSDNESQQAESWEQIKNSNDALNSEFANLKNQCEKSVQTITENTKSQNELKAENEALKFEIENLKNQYKSSSLAIVENAESQNVFHQQLKTENEELKTEIESLKKLYEDLIKRNETPDLNVLSQDIKTEINQIKEKTDGLIISRENIEKYLQDFYAEMIEKFTTITEELDKSRGQNLPENMGKKIDTFNDILTDFQSELVKLNDSVFKLSVSNENIEKNFQDLCNQTNEKLKTIKQSEVEVSAYKNEVLKNQLEEFKQNLTHKCKNICQKTSNKINDQLQSLVQQVQSKIDSLKARTFSKHVILSGESLSSIAKRYSTSPEQILITNNIQSARELRVGDTIIVPNNI